MWSYLLLFSLSAICVCEQIPTDYDDVIDCGGQLVAGQGSFESPGFPDYYPNEIDCLWTINSSPGDRVQIISEYFSLEYQAQCLWDYVEILETGNSSKTPWRFCGQEALNYTSHSNGVTIHFHTDTSTDDVGFRLKYNVIRAEIPVDYCNTTITKEGYVTSSNFPFKYPSSLVCYYDIQAPKGTTIHLNVQEFNVETYPCRFDRLSIYNVLQTGKDHLITLCGKRPEKRQLTSQTNHLLLVFITDKTQQYTGFNISVTFTSLFSSPILSLSSPSSSLPPTQPPLTTASIPPSTASPSTTTSSPITITTEAVINTTNAASTKTETATTMTSTATAPTTESTTTTVTTNTLLPESITVTPINSTSTSSVYNQDCSSIRNNDTGIITSPGYPETYPTNINCSTKLTADTPSSFVVHFHRFELEGSENCNYDSVLLSPDNVTEAVVLCGRKLDQKIYTFQTQNLEITFKSDKSVIAGGYSADYYITPIATDTCSLVCENEADCVKNFTGDNIPVWSCLCPDGYYGELCEKKRTTCTNYHCLNGGQCTIEKDKVQCICTVGYTGTHCDTQTDDSTFMFLRQPSNTSVARDSSVVLECGVNDLTVDVMWLHKDRILSLDDYNNGISIYPGGVLMIPVIREEHEGQYTCAARSGDNWIESSAWLSLVRPCHLRVAKKPKNLTREEGGHALFECFVPGGDSIVWLKDGDIVFSNGRKKILVNNYLMIEDLVEPDAGIYTCVATGNNGCFAKISAKLQITSTGHSEYCGRPIVNASTAKKYRIAGGRQAERDSAPWHVIIWEPVHGMAYCGGSLINENWVLTAAHCVTTFEDYFRYKFDKNKIKMFIGTRHCNGDGGITRNVKDYIIYPSFTESNFNNDLALFQLDEPVSFNDHVMPICLEREIFTSELLQSGTAGIVTGCGSKREKGDEPTFLHEVTIPYVPREVCRDAAKRVNASFTDYMICAGYARSMRGDACAGDSGGPYSMQFNGRWMLVGIVSWGVGCDRENQYGYYTHISKYYEWIMSITHNNKI